MKREPPPSRLTEEERRVRARVVREQIALMRRYADATGEMQNARWLLKEVVYRAWEHPQIPAPRFDKYSLWFPWSPRAQERLSTYLPGGKAPGHQGTTS